MESGFNERVLALVFWLKGPTKFCGEEEKKGNIEVDMILHSGGVCHQRRLND